MNKQIFPAIDVINVGRKNSLNLLANKSYFLLYITIPHLEEITVFHELHEVVNILVGY